MKQSLSPKELAEAIGVSESSLKRWADVGRVRVTRTMGGHRRIPLQEAVRFIREAQLPIVRPDVLGLNTTHAPTSQPLPGLDETTRTLQNLLVQGRSDEARALLLDMYLKGRPLAWLCDGPIGTAMAHLAELRDHDSKGVFIEHRAVDVCIHALTQIRLLLMPASAPAEGAPVPVALGGAPAGAPLGDKAMMDSLMSACIVAEAGYRDVNLGGNVPLITLLEAAVQYRPRLVWLSCSHPDTTPTPQAIDALGDQLAEINATLVVNGPTHPRGSGRCDNVRACASMAELSAFAGGLRSA